jgi:hypothetical protein
MLLTIKHVWWAGFFSDCGMILHYILNHIYRLKKVPAYIDVSTLFYLYDYNREENKLPNDTLENCVNNTNESKHEITDERKEKLKKSLFYKFFKNQNEIKCIIFNTKILYKIYYNYQFQSKKYTEIEYNILKHLKKKYKINYKNTISLYHRGTDKETETIIPNYEDYYNKLINIKDYEKKNILIQSDSIEFINYMKNKNDLKKIIIIDENKISYKKYEKTEFSSDSYMNYAEYGKKICLGIMFQNYKNTGVHFQNSQKENYENMLYLLPSFLIISQCEYFICNSSNCSLWICLFRGHGKNIIQYFNGTWYD